MKETLVQLVDQHFAIAMALVMAAVAAGALQGSVPLITWVERRGAGMIQDRPGPNRVGPWGLFQAIADAIKFLWKEDVIPTNADRMLYILAPALGVIPALTTFSVVPFGPSFDVTLFGAVRTIHLQVAPGLDAGILVLLGLVGMGVYGIVLAGWASNNKFSLMGGIRSSAQIISYELAMGIAIVGAVIPVGSLALEKLVAHQHGTFLAVLPAWGILTQPLGFLVFFIAAFAETNRTPFDMPECEAELVAGYHTEYSSMKFAMFPMAEYMNMVTSCAMTTTLFLGGWGIPWVDVAAITKANPALGVILGLTSFTVKVAFLLWVFVWVRWTVPRYRYDQLMKLGWKVLVPLAALNMIWAAFGTLAGWL